LKKKINGVREKRELEWIRRDEKFQMGEVDASRAERTPNMSRRRNRNRGREGEEEEISPLKKNQEDNTVLKKKSPLPSSEKAHKKSE